MARRNSLRKMKCQHETDLLREKERKEKLQQKRERKAKSIGKVTVKKVSSKVFRRMKRRQAENTEVTDGHVEEMDDDTNHN